MRIKGPDSLKYNTSQTLLAPQKIPSVGNGRGDATLEHRLR
jgi:hypothetical protein